LLGIQILRDTSKKRSSVIRRMETRSFEFLGSLRAHLALARVDQFVDRLVGELGVRAVLDHFIVFGVIDDQMYFKAAENRKLVAFLHQVLSSPTFRIFLLAIVTDGRDFSISLFHFYRYRNLIIKIYEFYLAIYNLFI